MKNNIILSQEIDQNKKYLGNKTLNLKKCLDWGFNVPKFIAIPSHISSSLYSDENLKKEIVQEIIKILQCKKYAIRSSALIEDGENKSFAGQFSTKLNLSSNELAGGIDEVLRQANDFLNGELDEFSIIIQEYITPDISGVTFTRNPNGGREMIVEYGFCEGEKIVSGEIKPEKISFYWNEKDIKLPRKFLTDLIIENFKNIENRSEFPQDIEWCIKDNEFYLLQTRPITTITSKHYEQINFLEKQLSEREYFFEKTEISEIAPRPTEFTLSLLKLIYSQNRPVSEVYKKYGVNFNDTDFLHIIGNELFIDKEKEIQSLLPAYSYLQNQNFVPKFSYYSKIAPTIKNFLFLNKIRTNGCEQIFQDLKTRIETKSQNQNFQTTLKVFLEDYKLIFETNLLSGLAIKKLNSLLKNEVVKLPDILNESSIFIDLNKYKVSLPQNLKGNSLEIADESNFSATEKTKNQSCNKVSQWWGKMSDFKKKMLQDKIKEAIIYNRLRELGRWLTIKNINAIRILLLRLAKTQGFSDLQNIYFANINEILDDHADEIVCKKRKNIHDQYNDYRLPNSITSSFIQKREEILGVSAGLAQGILQNHEYLDSKKPNGSKMILYAEILSPNLTKYFDRISGIVSENGGLLSHLAIVARENNIPVIVGFSLSNSVLKLGDSVQIDGSNGKIEKIQ